MSSSNSDLPLHAQRVLELTRTDRQLQRLVPDPSVQAAMRRPELPYDQIVAIALDGYAARPALGLRTYDVVLDATTGRHVREFRAGFETITYAELHDRVKQMANAWRHHAQHSVAPAEFVCTLGFAGVDFLTIDMACAYTRAVSVPLQGSIGRAALAGILADTAPVTVASTVTDVLLAAELAGDQPSVRSIIVFDYDERVDDERELVVAAQAELERRGSGVHLATIDDLVAHGRSYEWTHLPPTDEGGERLAMLMHSSGSTGTPKGAILLERHLSATFTAPAPPAPVISLTFAPMSHQTGRAKAHAVLAQGGTLYFVAKADLSTLFDDIRLVRPTESFFFPRALEMIHRHFQSEVARRTRNGGADLEAVQNEVMAEMRSGFLGDRLCRLTVGSAPTTPEVKQFIVDCFDVPFVEAYGTTEVGAVTINDRVNRANVIDYRLRDVPELGYYSTDQPYPRGELCVKTATAVSGYYQKPEATAALFDEDGFTLTGDIVEERGPDHVVHVARRNDVLKLAQGEFVATAALGETFEGGSDAIHQIYVYGSPTRPYLLAVVVPDLEQVRLAVGRMPDAAELRSLIRSELREVAAAAGLKSFEVPRDFIVEMEAFSRENGLLTALHKRIRPNLQERYGAQLERLYGELDRRQHDELTGLRDPSNTLGVLEKVGKALETALGVEDIDVSGDYNFAELGGDSLGATEFSSLLADIFGVDVPVSSILSPAGNPQQWARAIDAALQHEASASPTFATVHGSGARELRAADLMLETFIDENRLQTAPTGAPPDVSRTALVTGATGFLGRFLALEWLERVAPAGGKVICLVRAADLEAARQRLDATFGEGDPALEARYRALAQDHLDIVVGDVAAPGMGLDPDTFDRLATEVDRIVHPAALVNHVLDYEHLFAPNVAGVAEVIRLALSQRQKQVDFVSSAAVFSFLDLAHGLDERSPLLERVVLRDRYSEGYGASKWAAEHLLHLAHRRYGIPINVFRGNMMLPHRYFHGQINVDDIFTRLLNSIITTGVAPASFYEIGADGARPTAHYEGLPVDFIAAAIVAIGAEVHSTIRTFHVTSGHAADGNSLDDFVDWVIEAGYPIERVPRHDEWLRRFEGKLVALPEERRNLSSLGVIDSVRLPYRTAHEVGSEQFHGALQSTPLASGVPRLTRDYIEKCLADMCRRGLISPPRRTRQDRN